MASTTWVKLPKSKGIEYYVMAAGTKSYKLRALVNGQKYTDVLGPRSEEAREIKALLDRNRKIGRGPQTYEEMISGDLASKKAEAEERELDKLNSIQALSEKYVAERQLRDDRSEHDFKTIRTRHTKWIQPFLGKVLFSELEQSHIEALMQEMVSQAKSNKTIREVVAELGRLWTYALKKKIVKNPNTPFPGMYVELPKLNNQRQAFLTWEQAQELLRELDTERNREIHDYCLLTLYTGMRPSEIHRLTWNQIETGFVFKTKTGKQRPIFFEHEAVRAMLDRRRAMFPQRTQHDLVFPRTQADSKGNMDTPRKEVSDAFEAAIERMGFYTPIPAPKDKKGNPLPETPRAKAEREQQNRINKIVFYSLRHTFASWLVQMGTPLYVVKDAMGHSTQKMTERYSHLAPTHIKAAVSQLPTMQKTIGSNENRRRFFDCTELTI